MFTGLVQDIGIIRDVLKHDGGDTRYMIETNMNLNPIQMGASICCSGCCLTVVDKSENSFSVDVSRETLSKTHLGSWHIMTRINLEPSLKVGDELGGHFVSGHVDATTRILSITQDGGSHRVEIAIPDGFQKFIAPKGSIAIDGVSLTVNDVKNGSFIVNIIPHSWDVTTLGDRVVDDVVNLEIDMLARYVANMMNVKG